MEEDRAGDAVVHRLTVNAVAVRQFGEGRIVRDLRALPDAECRDFRRAVVANIDIEIADCWHSPLLIGPLQVARLDANDPRHATDLDLPPDEQRFDHAAVLGETDLAIRL